MLLLVKCLFSFVLRCSTCVKYFEILVNKNNFNASDYQKQKKRNVL